jgi:hypothetical protein
MRLHAEQVWQKAGSLATHPATRCIARLRGTRIRCGQQSRYSPRRPRSGTTPSSRTTTGRHTTLEHLSAIHLTPITQPGTRRRSRAGRLKSRMSPFCDSLLRFSLKGWQKIAGGKQRAATGRPQKCDSTPNRCGRNLHHWPSTHPATIRIARVRGNDIRFGQQSRCSPRRARSSRSGKTPSRYMTPNDFLIACAGKQSKVRYNGGLRLEDTKRCKIIQGLTLRKLYSRDPHADPRQDD